jgi:DNA replication and repair protein RecF
MGLRKLSITDFRCLESAELEFDARFNLISGLNASGKTSLLEAVFFLGRGRSFRTSRTDALVRHGTHAFMLTGRLGDELGGHAIGMQVTREGIEARFAGRPVTALAEVAAILPVQAIDPEVHRLIEEGPQDRRRYLDWGVFHVEPTFVGHWRRYQRGLRQRNAALRSGQASGVIRAWDQELVEAGRAVAEARDRYLQQLTPHVVAAADRLLGEKVELVLHRGWLADRTLEEALELSWARDVERGLTHSGPHRADLVIRIGGLAARDRISRGQQKLLAAAMLLGQLRCDAGAGSPLAALLVDDPAAELDRENLERLISEIVDLPAQLFVTALDPCNSGLLSLGEGHRFHVEHCKVNRLI